MSTRSREPASAPKPVQPRPEAESCGSARGGSPCSPVDPDLDAERAIPLLVRRYAKRIEGLGERICCTPSHAPDLVQETFVRALGSWKAFEGRSDPATWLHTIARRACSRMHRRRAGEPLRFERLAVTGDGEADAVEVPGHQSPERDASQREERSLVTGSICFLPPHLRLPLVLHELEDIEIAEIAAILDLPEGTVKSRLHRARNRLRERLEAPGRHPSIPPDRCLCIALDLVWARLEAERRGVGFPVPEEELVDRCVGLLEALELEDDVCRHLSRTGELTPGFTRAILEHFG